VSGEDRGEFVRGPGLGRTAAGRMENMRGRPAVLGDVHEVEQNDEADVAAGGFGIADQLNRDGFRSARGDDPVRRRVVAQVPQRNGRPLPPQTGPRPVDPAEAPGNTSGGWATSPPTSAAPSAPSTNGSQTGTSPDDRRHSTPAG